LKIRGKLDLVEFEGVFEGLNIDEGVVGVNVYESVVNNSHELISKAN